ncbi:MAG TPA: hypothetical protein VNJ70_07065 [Thermoanaerobaculia bacterium]|nr:hypothetical protein [Thermoanaerobaculia bacterium]
MNDLRVASFHVRATVAQSARWKIAAEAEGFPSVGAWAGAALDSYLKARARAGQPLPLAWRLGRFRVRLLDGAEPELRGWIAEPFAFYRGDQGGAGRPGCKTYTLTYLPELRALGTFHYARECKALAADLARQWVRAQAPAAPLP